MKLYLSGHDYKYAVEQMMLNLFPNERPEYPDELPQPDDQAMVVRLLNLEHAPAAYVNLDYDGRHYFGRAGCPPVDRGDKLSADRALQKIIKLAIYDAAVQALGKAPPWGALTGVRPVKIPTRAMAHGDSPAQARSVLEETYRVSPDRAELAMDCAEYSLAAQRSLRSDEVSLYVGIPFCPTRCAYCSFVSADVGKSLKLLPPFLEALHGEISAAGALLQSLGLHVRSVYIGGGTPTTLSAQALSALMGALSDKIDLSRCTEYTVEAGRPDTITAEKLTAIRQGGADRISVNPQTMQDHVLRAMGRAHSADDIRRAFQLARDCGIPCVNMDLIAGLPEDTAAGFCASLDQVLAMGPENVTVHTLALKKGSRLMGDGSGPSPALPSAEVVSEMLRYAWSTLRSAGQRPYYLYRQKYMSGSFENVGWCAPGFESLYNICMMEELHTILSVGGGGVTKLVNPKTGAIERIANPKYPYEYIESAQAGRLEKRRMAAFYSAMRQEDI